MKTAKEPALVEGLYGAGADAIAVWFYITATVSGGQVELRPSLLAVLIGMSERRVEDAIALICSRSIEGQRLGRVGVWSYEFAPAEVQSE